MWPIVIVLLVIAMLVGPIMMMQPSESQRRLAKLRQKAAEIGFAVSSSTVKTGTGELCWFYWLAMPEITVTEVQPLLCVKNNYEHGMHVAKFWSIKNANSTINTVKLEQCLASLPGSVYAFELNDKAIGVHWSEAGGEAVLGDIQKRLQQFMASC